MISARASKTLTATRAVAAEQGSAGPELGLLPEWDLGDLYPGRDSPELAHDLAASGRGAAASPGGTVCAGSCASMRARNVGWVPMR